MVHTCVWIRQNLDRMVPDSVQTDRIASRDTMGTLHLQVAKGWKLRIELVISLVVCLEVTSTI